MLWERESLLLPGALLHAGAGPRDSPRPPAIWWSGCRGSYFLPRREPVRLNRPFIRLDANKPGPVEQKQLWHKALGQAARTLNGTLDDLSEQFRLSARTDSSTGYLLASEEGQLSPTSCGTPAARWPARSWKTWRSESCLAPSWDDLILPELAEANAAAVGRAGAAPHEGV